MKITVETKSGEFEFTGSGSESLLFAGLSSGLTLPYECATGTCGSCRARVMKGATDCAWYSAPGLSKIKRDKGDVLMCQMRPTEDCVLRVPANVARKTDGHEAPLRRSAKITSACQLTDDVIHFEARLERPMSFDAGQFVVIESPFVTGGRAYSMVNYAPEVGYLAFVVKRKPGGGFSDWLFERNVIGTELSLFGPLGAATFRPIEDRDLLIIAGGSGIAGMMAIIEHAVIAGHFNRRRAHVFFGVREMKDGFYLQEFDRYLAKAGPALSVTLALSDEQPATSTHPRYPRIRLGHGFVHEVAARGMVGSNDELTAFVAGPPPMVDGALRMLLADARVSPPFIRYDKFG